MHHLEDATKLTQVRVYAGCIGTVVFVEVGIRLQYPTNNSSSIHCLSSLDLEESA